MHGLPCAVPVSHLCFLLPIIRIPQAETFFSFVEGWIRVQDSEGGIASLAPLVEHALRKRMVRDSIPLGACSLQFPVPSLFGTRTSKKCL